MKNQKKQFLSVLVIMALLPFLNSCVFIYNTFDFGDKIKPLEEMTLAGSGSDRILMIDISGEINDNETSSFLGLTVNESPVALLHDQLMMAAEDSNLKAVVLRIDSPGGAVTASDIIYREIKNFRQAKQIPIYAQYMDVAASGAYYISMAADRIYAHPTCITGSIGVIMFNLSFEGLMKKVGVTSKVIKSGPNKDIGSPLKDLTPEEKQILQAAIDDLYQQFVQIVTDGRPNLTKEQILKLADGRIYTAKQAEKVGLIDGISTLPDTLEMIKRDLKLTKTRVVSYKRPNKQMTNIYSHVQGPMPQNLSLIDDKITRNLGAAAHKPGFYFLWQP